MFEDKRTKMRIYETVMKLTSLQFRIRYNGNKQQWRRKTQSFGKEGNKINRGSRISKNKYTQLINYKI